MAADGQIDEGPPLTELESLQLKANNITDESLDSTRRMITLCEEVKTNFTDQGSVINDVTQRGEAFRDNRAYVPDRGGG